MSHPVWVCGLKLLHTDRVHLWDKSHPVWVCGLKPAEKQAGLANVMSHPVWVCGLKLIFRKIFLICLSHTLYGCVD